MINLENEILEALSTVFENVGNSSPTDWELLPAIQYSEVENQVYEYTDGKEEKSLVRYQIDIWHDTDTFTPALDVDNAISGLGLLRTSCRDVPEELSLRHKIMQYEGIIDNVTKLVYHNKSTLGN